MGVKLGNGKDGGYQGGELSWIDDFSFLIIVICVV